MQNFTTASLNGHLEMEEQILQLQKFINDSRYTVAITGAGISMTAGIMDFALMNFTLVLSLSPANEFFGGVEKCAEPLLQYGEESVFKCHV